VETIAVYWESKIRTYGFDLYERLTLCQITLPPRAMGTLGQALRNPGDDGAVFRLVWAQTDNSGRLKFYFLYNDAHPNRLHSFVGCFQGSGNGIGPVVRTAVDVIGFQGPHFGDRHGILDFTHNALAHGQVPILAVTCSVATIYLVLPTGRGRDALAQLSEAFEVPKSIP
jgi:hypothetical protein